MSIDLAKEVYKEVWNEVNEVMNGVKSINLVNARWAEYYTENPTTTYDKSQC